MVLADDPMAPAALALESNLLGLAADREEEVDVVDDPPRRHNRAGDLRDRDVLHHWRGFECGPRPFPLHPPPRSFPTPGAPPAPRRNYRERSRCRPLVHR